MNFFKCKQCDKEYTSQEGLDNHQKYHTGELPQYCPRCGADYYNHVTQDYYYMHNAKLPNIHCNNCGFDFLVIQNTHGILHIISNKKEEIIKKLCEICKKRILNLWSMGEI